MPAIDQWLMWKEKCALALCPADMHPVLQEFIHTRFHSYSARYARAFSVSEAEAVSPDAREAWHWFETYFQLHATRQGKSYKEWLFARAEVAHAAGTGDVESGVSLLLRDVVRDRLRKEHSSRLTLSLEADICRENGGTPVSIKDLLPGDFDTADAVERHEIEHLAGKLAESAFGTLSFRERIALLGREIGVSLASPEIVKLAGCGKSMLAEAYRSALTAVAHHVAGAYPDEPGDSQAALTVAVFGIIKSRIISWAGSEKSLSGFLNRVEGPLAMVDTASSRVRSENYGPAVEVQQVAEAVS